MVKFIFLISFVIIEAIYFWLFNDCTRLFLEKKSRWFHEFLLCLMLLAYTAVLFSWLPTKIGYEIYYFDGALVLKAGALYQNLSILCLITALSVLISLFKFLWHLIRRKTKFSGRFFLLELFLIATFGYASIRLSTNETILTYDPAVEQKNIIGYIAAGVFLFIRIRKHLSAHD